MINSACIGLCHGYRDHNYGRRYWCLRELGLFCKYVWVRKGNLYSFIVKFHWAVIFFELLWGSSHWGKKGQEKRERVPFCSGLTVCSDAVKTGWSVLLEAAAFLSCILDSGHVRQVSLSYSATRILHSTLHSSPRVVFVEEHVSRLVSVTCSVVCSGQFTHDMRKSWSRCVTMRTSRTPAKMLTLPVPCASPWCAQALPVTTQPLLALPDPPSHFTKLSLLCASFPRHQLWWHHAHWTQIGFRTLPKVPPPPAASLRWPEQALENLSLVDAWLSLLWVHLSAVFPILLSSPFYPG